MDALLTQRGDIATNPAKPASTLGTAEATRDLLAYLDHPKVAFGQVVVERHFKVVHEGKDTGSVLVQALQQIPSRALLRRPRLPGTGSGAGFSDSPCSARVW